jgi:hypothetical protein
MGSKYDLPATRGDDLPFVADASQLKDQGTAGFYAHGLVGGGKGVAYVVPFGQLDRVPAGVLNLPVVKAILDTPPGAVSDFEIGTVVVFGPEAELLIAKVDPAQAVRDARKGAGAASKRRPLARKSAADAYQCDDNFFCIYDCTNWRINVGGGCSYRIQFGASFTGTGWHGLGNYGYNDVASSMRNRRDRDSLLAQHWQASPPNGYGNQYCAESHSADGTFDNNAIGNDQASAFANVPDDIHC